MFSRLLSSFAVLVGYYSTDAADNVLFIMADQMRWDTISERYTPNLFKLRSQGLEMKNTYSSTPSCTPARSALLTGLSPWYNGMLGYGEIAPQVSLLLSHTTFLSFIIRTLLVSHDQSFASALVCEIAGEDYRG